MAEKRKKETKAANSQRDKVDRPAPSIDAAEGDLETIEENLRNQGKKRRSSGGGA